MSGLGDKLQGAAKQAAGKLTGDDKTEAEGTTQRIVGNVKDKAEELKNSAGEKVNDALDDVEKKTRNDDE